MDGIIWNEIGELDKCVGNAVKAFEKRFVGKKAGVVEVHRSRLEAEKVIQGIQVKPVRNLLRNDYFVTEAE